jgi:hypothetical protein
VATRKVIIVVLELRADRDDRADELAEWITDQLTTVPDGIVEGANDPDTEWADGRRRPLTDRLGDFTLMVKGTVRV